jgi:AcrR family transcriptional regulator
VLPSPVGPPLPWHGPTHLPGAHTRSGNAMGRTRLGLLTGAARAFAEHGLRRSTMQSIAAAAGVAKATLYNHFRTKDDVATALLGLEIDRLTTLAAGLPLEQALAALSDELGAHPVLRRLAETEPEALARLLAVDADRWADLSGRLAASLRVDDEAAEIAARWLLGVVLQPGRSTARHRHAARLADLLSATGAAASA